MPLFPSAILDFLRDIELEFTECIQLHLQPLGAFGFHFVSKTLCGTLAEAQGF